MANFLDDTRVEGIGEPERGRAELSPSWAVWGPNGGYVAAIALRAAMARSRLPRPASFHCDFLAVGEFARVERHFTKACPCAAEPLVNVGFRREEPSGDLPDVEAAQRLQRQDELGFERDGFIAAHEEHAKEVVAEVSGEARFVAVVRRVEHRAVLNREREPSRLPA